MLNKLRKFIIKKLIRPDDGYTYTGFSEGEPIKFYYQEDTGKYLVGKRSDNWYYFEPGLSGWHSYASRYLPWGQTVEKCVFNPITKEMDAHTYSKEPKEIGFKDWMYGILDNIHEEYVDNIMGMTYQDLIDNQRNISIYNKKYQDEPWIPYVTKR